jgi:hypothetical protein
MNGLTTGSAIGTPQGGATAVGSTSDIFGVRKKYGVPNLGTDDSDGDGRKDFQDNCPFVPNGLFFLDSNRDAERAKAIQAGWTGSPNTAEGELPQAIDLQSDDGRYYIQHFLTWYKGDACDNTPVSSNALTGVSSELDFGGCVSCIGRVGIVGTCPKALTKGRMELDSYISSETGLPWDNTGLSVSYGASDGTSRPAVCYCPLAESDRDKCQLFPYFCKYATDMEFPNLGADQQGSNWKRMTQETFSQGTWSPAFIDTEATFAVPAAPECPFAAPKLADARWNPFHSWFDFSNTQVADIARLGLGLNITSFTGVVWTHVVSYPGKPNLAKPDFANSYVGVTPTIETGCVNNYEVNCREPCWQWTPIGWYLDDPDPFRSGLIDWLTIQPTPSGPAAIALTALGATDVTNEFSGAALAQLASVAQGTTELLVADDNATGRYAFLSRPSALIVDPGTTTIRAALTKTSGSISVQVAGNPLPAPDPLRAYSALNGALYALDGATLATYDVPAALANNPLRTSLVITGAAPKNPLAMAWVMSTNKLYVADEDTISKKSKKLKYALRLIAIDVTSGVGTELWRTRAKKKLPITKGFLSLTAAGDPLFSYNLDDGSYEAFVMRPDGRPAGSLRGTGALHKGVLSDGAGFTVLKNQTMTASQPNVALSFTGHDALGGGVCGTKWFRRMVGDQSGKPLGRPKSECRDGSDDDEDDGED